MVCGSVEGRKLSRKLWKNTASSPKVCFAHDLSAKVLCMTLMVLLLCGAGFCLAEWSVVGMRGEALFSPFQAPGYLVQSTAEGVGGSGGVYLPAKGKSQYCSWCSTWKPLVMVQCSGQQRWNVDLLYLQFRANCFLVHYRQLEQLQRRKMKTSLKYL